jgi:1-acyl-sn-glycerol-3-phosphate acyltransferase
MMNGMQFSLAGAFKRLLELFLACLFAVLVIFALEHLGLPPLAAGIAGLFLGAKLYLFLWHSDLYLVLATRAFSQFFYRIRVSGRENMPGKGGVLLICNHVSFIDWIIVFAFAGRPVRFVIDHVFYRGPILRFILDLVHVIPIADPREDKSKLGQAYARIYQALDAGEVVCVFPEGSITYDGKMNSFKPGVMKILRNRPVPVVPMALSGLWGSFFSRHGGRALRTVPRQFRMRVDVKIGAPLAPETATIKGLEEAVAALRGPSEPR